MGVFTDIVKQYPLLYAFYIMLNSLIIGIGAGFGLYKGINKLFDYWINIKVNTDEIPALIELNKDNHKAQQREIRELKKILEKHDLEVKEEFEKRMKDEEKAS